MRLAVTCGYPTSLQAIALIHQLTEAGHQVVLCLTTRVWNLPRLRFLLRQIGWRKLLGKVRAKMGSSAGAAYAGETEAIRRFVRDRGIEAVTVKEVCRHTGTRLLAVSSLNSPDALEALRAAEVDLAVYAGGGIVRKPFLGIPRLGLLNAHGGPLPFFRGMNASEWALFHGVRPSITVHLIDAGIDTGPVLFQREIPPDSWRQGVCVGRGASVRTGVEALLEAVAAISQRDPVPTAQEAGAGRQYFVMADPLLEIVERWAAEGRTPMRSPEEFHFPAPAQAAGPGWA